MKALDLFSGAGGASMGLHRAGYEVTGVDIKPQPRYPFTFIQADALTFPLDGYDLIWASPPCQPYSITRALHDNTYAALVEQTRERLASIGAPYIIENVVGAPLRTPLMLCGTMFPPLKVYRHRLFESNVLLLSPPHPRHTEVIGSHRGRGRKPRSPNGWVTVTGGNAPPALARVAMGISWMSGYELTQAIPPIYAEYLARQVRP